MKKYLSLLLGAALPLAVSAIYLSLVSLNIAVALGLCSAVLLLVSIWHSGTAVSFAIKLVILALPVSVVFYLLIVTEIPGLWIALPVFIIMVAMGLLARGKATVAVAIAGVLAIWFVSMEMTPGIISDSLSETVNEPAPAFSMQNVLDGGQYTRDGLRGKVVVLDFFGTWCAPCIAEMKELKPIYQEYAQSDDVVFLLACTEKQGDTPEAARRFVEKRNLPFKLAFDKGSAVHQRFNFTGVPGLLILDKQGNVRFKHEGFNEAEDLEATLVPVIEELLQE